MENRESVEVRRVQHRVYMKLLRIKQTILQICTIQMLLLQVYLAFQMTKTYESAWKLNAKLPIISLLMHPFASKPGANQQISLHCARLLVDFEDIDCIEINDPFGKPKLKQRKS